MLNFSYQIKLMDFTALHQVLIKEASALHFAEIVSVITAIIYLFLASKENAWCWFFGIISCVFWAWAAYFLYDLYIDTLLQIFYVAISFLGIYRWRYGDDKKKSLPISRLSTQDHLFIIIGGLGLSYVFGWLFSTYTSAAATYIDAFTTIFSVITTFMVINKKLENWIYWFVIDVVYVYLYWTRGSTLFSLLFVIYLFIVISGWKDWLKSYQKSIRPDIST